jgi:ankyrin repeat protein
MEDQPTCRQHHSSFDPSADNNIAIREASANGHEGVVRLLLADARVDPAALSNYPIRWATENGHTDVVKLLLADARVDPSVYNNYPIRFASENGHTDMVRLLLAWRCPSGKRVDPSDKNNDAIIFASYYGHTEIVRLLLAHERVDPADMANDAIIFASQNGHTDVFNLLLVWYASNKLPIPGCVSIDPSQYESLFQLNIARHMREMTRERIDRGGWRALANYIKPLDQETRRRISFKLPDCDAARYIHDFY